jgi:ribosomal protein S18 acetylase RimI-like enzyme
VQEELKYLEDKGFHDDSYAYVACMAVEPEARRSGAASALLGAAERMAGKWQQNWVLLHVYTDNFPGLRLYHRNGCELCNPKARGCRITIGGDLSGKGTGECVLLHAYAQ